MFYAKGDSINMETSPTEQRERPSQSASSVLPNRVARPTVRLPFRPVGALMRCPAPSSPLQVAPLAASLGRQLQHLARAAFINPNFALLCWGQAISSVGDYAWDTALVLWVASRPGLFLHYRQSARPRQRLRAARGSLRPRDH